jgi:hypothetical protein
MRWHWVQLLSNVVHSHNPVNIKTCSGLARSAVSANAEVSWITDRIRPYRYNSHFVTWFWRHDCRSGLLKLWRCSIGHDVAVLIGMPRTQLLATHLLHLHSHACRSGIGRRVLRKIAGPAKRAYSFCRRIGNKRVSMDGRENRVVMVVCKSRRISVYLTGW